MRARLAHSLRTLPILVLFAVALSATPATADELQLQNGDRITGEVVGLGGGNLTYKTPGGDLTIPWNTITALTSTATLRIRIANRPGTQTITGMTTPGAGQLMLIPGGLVAFADVTDLGPVESEVTVNGGVSAGFLNSRGNTEVNSLRLDADLAVRADANRYTGAASINSAEDRGVKTSQNRTGSFNYDRFLTTRLFVNANAIFANDRFRDLHLRSALGSGIGYQVFDAPHVKLTANGGFGWVNEDFLIAVDNDYSAARESAALDVLAIPNRLLFFHKHDGYVGLAGADNLFVKTQNGVRITVVKTFVTTVQYDVDYDASPSPGRKSTERNLALTFGYRF